MIKKNLLRLIALLALVVPVGALGQHNRIYMDDFEIAPDSTVTVPVIMANEDTTYGFQFHLTPPEGLQVRSVRKTPHINDLGLSLLSSKEGGMTIVLLYSMEMLYCPPDTAEVVTVKFQADPGFRGGDIIIDKCLGSKHNTDGIFLDGDTVHVSIPSSGVALLNQDAAPVQEHYYNLQGQPITSPDSVPVAIKVTTAATGERTARKVTVKP